MRSGQDGADLALLDALGEDIREHFQHVVLVSGDGIFTEAVTALRLAATRVVHLDEPRLPARAAG